MQGLPEPKLGAGGTWVCLLALAATGLVQFSPVQKKGQLQPP